MCNSWETAAGPTCFESSFCRLSLWPRAQPFLHKEALALLLQAPWLGEKGMGTEDPFYIQEFLFSLQPKG